MRSMSNNVDSSVVRTSTGPGPRPRGPPCLDPFFVVLSRPSSRSFKPTNVRTCHLRFFELEKGVSETRVSKHTKYFAQIGTNNLDICDNRYRTSFPSRKIGNENRINVTFSSTVHSVKGNRQSRTGLLIRMLLILCKSFCSKFLFQAHKIINA